MVAEQPEPSTSANDLLLPLMVHLEQSLHFNNSDGQDTIVSPVLYLVEPISQGNPLLAFWHEHGTLTLQATRTTHDQPLKTPETYLLREETNEDRHHVVVFLPDGVALESIGSISGIQPRGNFRVSRHYQLDAATGVVQFGDGQQGRRIPKGQSNISPQDRNGSGSQNSEISMFQLQSVISQRQSALALTTNLIHSLQGRFQWEEHIDRTGQDYVQHRDESPEACRTRCAGDTNCQAFTFVKPRPGSSQGQCFLKRSEPQPVANHCCASGPRSSAQEKIIQHIR
jgi:hypothetical protein